jgi:sigma-54 interacting transcriptional regulator
LTNDSRADVRVIAATNRDLSQDVQARRFRADLFYRLNVYRIAVPPLRQRREDIPLLVEHFVRVLFKKMGKEITSVAPSALEALCFHFLNLHLQLLQFSERPEHPSRSPAPRSRLHPDELDYENSLRRPCRCSQCLRVEPRTSRSARRPLDHRLTRCCQERG